jgi:hypothetical protein
MFDNGTGGSTLYGFDFENWLLHSVLGLLMDLSGNNYCLSGCTYEV